MFCTQITHCLIILPNKIHFDSIIIVTKAFNMVKWHTLLIYYPISFIIFSFFKIMLIIPLDEALNLAPGFVITSIFSMEPAGSDFNASFFDIDEVLPLIITVTPPCPLNEILPSGSTLIDGILFNISVAELPAEEISLSTLNIILLFLNSTPFFF